MKQILLIAFFLTSCHSDFSNEENSTFRVTDDNSRITEKDETITIETQTRSKKTDQIVLTLIGEVASPIIEGDTLQATTVVLKGNRVYIGYNFKGVEFKGAADIVELKKLVSKGEIKFESSVEFPNSDVNGIAVSGSDVYFAMATDNPLYSEQSIAGYIKTKSHKFKVEDAKFVELNSFAATSIHISGNDVLVTTGSTGGLYTFSKKNLMIRFM